TSSSGTATYTITPASNGCNGTPIVVVVTVDPASVVTTSPLTAIRCSGAGPLNFTPAFTVAGTTFTWTSSISGTVNPASVTASGTSTIVDNPTNTGSSFGTVTYTFIPTSPGGCVGTAFDYVVTVNPEPVGVNDIKSICSDESVGYNLLLNLATLGNNVGSTFSWVATDNVNPLVTGESTVPVAGPTITDVLVNQTNTDQLVVYTVTPTSTNGCVGAAFQITVTVKPEPVGVSATAPDICSGSSVGYDLQNNVDVLGNALAANFTWTAAPHANVTGETTSLQSGSVIDDVLINNSGVNQLVTYTVTPTSQTGTCLGNSFTIQVNVNPKAIFTAGPDLAVCVNQNDIEIQGSVTFAPSTYSWSGGTGTFDDNTLEKPRYILSVADKAITVPTVRVLSLTTAASGVCPAEVETMNLTLNPLPNASFIGLPPSTPENGPDLKLNAFQAGGLFTIVPGSGLTATTIDGGTGFDQAFLTPANATIYDGTPATVNVITYSFTDANGCSNTTSQSLRVNPLTTVDFIIQNSTTDGDGDFRICADTGDLLLTPIDGGNPGIPPTQFESLTPGLNVSFDGSSNYYVQTNNVVSGIYTIRFTYTNALGVTSFKERNVKVQASPVVSFTSTGTCIDSPTTFTNTSTINVSDINVGTPTIGLVEWNFGDFSGAAGPPAGTIPAGTNGGKTTGTYDNPSHTYGVASSYTVSLKVTTSQGCASTYTSPTSVVVGTIPVVDFDYFAICNNDSTKFKAIITNLGSSTVAQYDWNFDDGDVLSGLGPISPPANSGRTIGTYAEPIHKYISIGSYDPTLTVTTNLGCTSLPKTRPVTIVPYVTIVASSSSPPENFDTPAGWFIENLIDPDDNTFVSWKHGVPSGTEINAGNSAGNVWWSGNNGNTYFANEKSVVNSPCFDLDALERPMIALDYFSDLENSLDGVVLQYSIDGGANWEIVGPGITETRDQGINWFNGAGIPSNPGNQILGQYGWTNKQGGWKNARFNLDMIPEAGMERKQVRFRLALASNSTNAPGVDFDGFAFDNVYVGEKQRNVLVEHFTTSQLNISLDADSDLNDLYQDQLTFRGFSDFDQIQYHVNFNGVDQFNRDNPEDPAARALRYRVSQPPYTIMDGLLEPGKFTGRWTELNRIELDRRALVDPVFDLQLTDLPTSENTRMSVRLTLTARQDYTQPVLINVALLEKEVSGFKNVLRKNLFTPAGLVIELPFTAGQIVNREALDVVLDVPIVDPNNLMLVGYVQDLQSNEILQSVVMRTGVAPKQTDPITAVDDTPALATLKSIQVFPNPASLEFNFGLPARWLRVQAGRFWINEVLLC
ncbi:MAG: PKD domain-containing protein, partial [Bacteroidetes bacterium OLB12]